MPDDGDEIALSSGLHLQDGEPVLGIVVGDALDSARKRFERRCCLRSGRSEGHGSERIVLSIDLEASTVSWDPERSSRCAGLGFLRTLDRAQGEAKAAPRCSHWTARRVLRSIRRRPRKKEVLMAPSDQHAAMIAAAFARASA